MELDLECRRCRLSDGRTRVVPPDGDRTSRICLIGEAPGKNEDLEGRPFVGRSGKLLTRMLDEGGLPREKVMVANTVKYVLVLLGRSACRSVLDRDVRLVDEANKVIRMNIGSNEVDVIPTYHPSACLRNLKARDGLRETIRMLKRYD